MCLLFLFTYLYFSGIKKCVQSQEELDWKGCIAQFFNQKLDITERVQQNWWAGTQQKVRKGIDGKWSTFAMAIKKIS